MFAIQIQTLLLLVLTLALFVAQIWAFADAVSRRPDAFTAADKMTKGAWVIILGIALAAHLIFFASPISFLNLIGAVAAIVYLVDARPAMRSLTRR